MHKVQPAPYDAKYAPPCPSPCHDTEGANSTAERTCLGHEVLLHLLQQLRPVLRVVAVHQRAAALAELHPHRVRRAGHALQHRRPHRGFVALSQWARGRRPALCAGQCEREIGGVEGSERIRVARCDVRQQGSEGESDRAAAMQPCRPGMHTCTQSAHASPKSLR